MKPDELGAISQYINALDEDLEARVEEIFGRHPSLRGFSVQGTEALPEPMRSAVMTNTLVVAEVGVDPICGTAYSEKVSDEIAVVLLDFVKERPEGAELLRDRTFARKLQ
ncbi:MAG TPA: hypothetical protein VEB41_01145 [Burkholderiales bacterium]|nr:hypothetical protein [Burkholderiales bacterium]